MCAVASSIEDGSRPSVIGLQEQITNHCKQLLSKAKVVSVTEKIQVMYQVGIKKTNISEPLTSCRNSLTDVKTRDDPFL